jgi:hypothetical protein
MTDYFVDATGGSDAAAGTSEGTAWQTISKVNAASFSAGDSIAFKRGEEWRETLTPPSSGSSGSPITFTAYGSSALPIINGADVVTGWTNTSGNVWEAAVSWEARNVYLDGSKMNQGTGQNASDYGSVASFGAIGSGDFYWDDSDNKLYIYATSDPDSLYALVEVSRRSQCINVSSKNYVTCETLAPKYANSINAQFSGTSDNCIFDGLSSSFANFDGIKFTNSCSNCTVKNGRSFSNGKLFTSGDANANNIGHGVNFASTGDDNLCELIECDDNAEDGFQVQSSVSAKYTCQNCNLHDNHEDGVDLKTCTFAGSLVQDNDIVDNHIRGVQTHKNGTVGGLKFFRNKVTGNGSVGVWVQGDVGSTWEIFANLIAKNGNASRNYTGSLKEGIRIEPGGSYTSVKIYHCTIYLDVSDEGVRLLNADADNVDVRNTICVLTIANQAYQHSAVVTGAVDQNNLWRNSSGTSVVTIDGTNYSRTEINDGTYTTAESLGQNTVDADPKFVDAANDDYRLKVASAAVGAGATGLGVSTDVNGDSYASPPNMGAIAGSVGEGNPYYYYAAQA